LLLEKPRSPKAGKWTPPEREDNGYVGTVANSMTEDPDLVLDVPVLRATGSWSASPEQFRTVVSGCAPKEDLRVGGSPAKGNLDE
jgi:hypothetical protein